MPDGDVIIVDELRKVYDETEALAGITFAVRRGEVFGLLGPNGSGKTTSLAGTRVTVVTDDADAVLRRLTFTSGLRAFDYSVRHGSLEDVFLDVSHTTADEARDTIP